MILQELYRYYQRKPELPREGFEFKDIPFVIELSREGEIIQFEDTRTQEGRRKRAKSYLVPQGEKKSVNVAANLLWGNVEYVLGLPDSKKLDERKAKGKEAEYHERLQQMHKAFLDKVLALADAAKEDEGVRAVLSFLSHIELEKLQRHEQIWKEIEETNPNLTFRLQGDRDLVCQRHAVVSAVVESEKGPAARQVCLVTGEPDETERLHSSIRGVRGAQTAGANIVSFNLDAFNSFGKEQGTNAPIGKQVAFAYTTALNYLLRDGSKQRIQIGDATTVFWSDKPSVLEDHFSDIFDEPPKDDPDRAVRAVRSLFEAPQQGVMPATDEKTRFFVLGLAPNAARIAVRFWHVGTVAAMVKHIKRHFDDLEIVKPDYEKPYLSLFRLLVATAALGKADNIPPNLGGEVMRAVLSGQSYPQTLLQGAVRRIRAEHEVTYPRAAIIKACLNRFRQSQEEEITVSLDNTNASPGYRLGRLFAVLEKVQEEASPGINATIRDRFYGAASSTPVAVFSNLMKLKNHHLAKLENQGRRVNLERLIGEIMDGITDFPAHLSLSDQGRFAVGYYHQRQAFFVKSIQDK